MKPSLLRILLAAAGWATGLAAAEPAIIAKARSFLGSEEALTGVTSVHMVGSMESILNGATTPPNKAQVDIVFQKPYQESLKIVTGDQLARKVLDGYNGWQLTQANQPGGPAEFDPKQSQRLTILGIDQIRILRADTWENLRYYRGLEAAGGSTEDLGPATIDGVACEKVALRYSDLIVYYRYFDLATGRLVFTETYAGAKIHEAGEIVVQGIRFPKKITVDEPTGGKVAHTTITIDQVTLNEAYPADFFATPSPPMPIHPAAPDPALPGPLTRGGYLTIPGTTSAPSAAAPSSAALKP